MKYKVSKRDWETISAYLDGQLSTGKKTRLESRLKKDHQLSAILDELRNTRLILRNSPRLRAPRNFTLSPEMAGHPLRLPQLAPVFGWASAVASFLLVLILMGDFFNAGKLIQVASDIPAQEADIAPRSQVVEHQVPTEQGVAGEVEVPLKQSAEEITPPEDLVEMAPLEVAVEPAMESTPTQESTSESDEIDAFVDVEEIVVETPQERSSTTAMRGAISETPAEVPESYPVEGSGDQQQVNESMAASQSLVESTPISETPLNENVQEPTAELLAEESKTTQFEEEQSQSPSSESTETLPISEPQVLEVEQPLTENGEMIPTLESTSIVAWPSTDIPEIDSMVLENTRDFVSGTEVLLALFALSTGLAWFYMRHRGR